MEKHPVLFSLFLTLLAVGLLFLSKLMRPDPVPLFYWPRLITLLVMSGVAIYLIQRWNWQERVGLTKGISAWHPKWFLASIPMLLLALLSLTSVNWNDVHFSSYAVSAWLLSNFATGFFEEALMRGVCFFVLLKAWGNSVKGVYYAALGQAVIFGVAHLTNLYHTPAVDVLAQVVFATLIGLGFAGLVSFTGSIWPAVIIHSMINMTGTINAFLVPSSSITQSSEGVSYGVVIFLFFVLSTIPGLFFLKASKNNHLAWSE